MLKAAYDKQKFRELVVYIAERSADDPRFADTKLIKLLYFCDFFAYSHLGHPMTGARYQKLEHGPAPRALLPVRTELQREGAVAVEDRGDRRRVTVALRSANTKLFTSDELGLVEELLHLLRNETATSISALSHVNSPGWRLAEMGEDIPYQTALVARDRPTPAVIDRGRELALEFDW